MTDRDRQQPDVADTLKRASAEIKTTAENLTDSREIQSSIERSIVEAKRVLTESRATIRAARAARPSVSHPPADDPETSVP